MDSSLYREEILEHYKDPQNFGVLDHCDVHGKQTNPFCGDEVEIFISLEKNKIGNIRFRGKGCAISIAAASILTEFAKGKSKKELTNLTDEDMLGLLGVEVSETRKKCALLALATLKDSLEN